nr:MAG TPA: hypothetical protein [Caudoviricetes sp.]
MEEMTASEILRYNADDNWSAGVAGIAMALDVEEYNGRVFELLANKIDIELAEAKKKAAYSTDRPLSEVMAHYTGLYAKGAEPIGDWLDRWFLPRPRFEDGEPVHIGDKAEHPYTGETCTIDCINTFNGSYCLGFVDERSASLLDRERVKRPAPEVLGADGLPILAGETVYRLSDGERLEVLLSHGSTPETREYVDCCGELELPSNLTHTPPDTQERIDEDARKDQFEYWQCREHECDECPAEIEGMSPKKRYGCNDCCSAMTLDLLRRQRELDKRTGGAE